MIKINKITLNNFKFFIDEIEHNTFEPNGKNMLLYGENGSGKSSIFKAFEFLTKPTISSEEFEKSINIFKQDDTYLEFEFNNNETLRIDSDHLSLDNQFSFIEKLSIPKPILNYKSLLDISYSIEQEEKKNLYKFFEIILAQYPVEDNIILDDLRVAESDEYFTKFENILKQELFNDINIFLDKFNQNFILTDININFGFQKINLDIEYFDKKIENYHTFLNEARLSSLAISIYFAIIKKQFELLREDSLKILVLDDLLISLDMDNRINLLDILKTEFSDFQIFFFTHDKNLSELIKSRLDLKNYELYVDLNEEFEVPFLKKSKNLLEEAKHHKINKEYDCSANKLRQYLEKLLCDILPTEKLVNKNCKSLDLNGLVQNCISYKKNNENIINILKQLQVYRKILFNPSSHYNNSNIYKKELLEAIEIIEDLSRVLSPDNTII